MHLHESDPLTSVANHVKKLNASRSVDRRISVYIESHKSDGFSYTDLQDNAIRSVLYDQEQRLQAIEEHIIHAIITHEDGMEGQVDG